jgi:MoxR-like ATPase
MDAEITEINGKAIQYGSYIHEIMEEIEKVIVGQKYLIERILVALLADGHLLIEGVPGLAKTTVVKTISDLIDARAQRIQFTPDLLPADLIGTLVYNPRNGDFTTRKGPIFTNILLADEINRAPAKVHSALLEAMEERQVTIGDNSYPLAEPFMVMATQNPIEQEGTYPLPEAQMDRFMLKITITYPNRNEEREIMQRASRASRLPAPTPIIHPADIVNARSLVDSIYLDEKIEKYILDLVFATREPTNYGFADLGRFISYGASPRASIYMAASARALAFIRGRGYVIPQDIKDISPDILRHRIITTYEADVEGITVDRIIGSILSETEVP